MPACRVPILQGPPLHKARFGECFLLLNLWFTDSFILPTATLLRVPTWLPGARPWVKGGWPGLETQEEGSSELQPPPCT